jgi:hypothetical protein
MVSREMNIPQSAIQPFEPLGVPTLSPMEPPVAEWGSGFTKTGWTPGPDEGGGIYAPYIPLTTSKLVG